MQQVTAGLACTVTCSCACTKLVQKGSQAASLSQSCSRADQQVFLAESGCGCELKSECECDPEAWFEKMSVVSCLQELFPGTFQPTPAHFFMKLLHDKGLLLRCFTQNIDSLENQAGLDKEQIVAAHGNFDSECCM